MQPALPVVALIGLLLGVSVTPGPGHPPASTVCSKFPTPGLKTANEPYFLGTATPDTVLAGPGEIRLRRGEGHFAMSGKTWKVYGQVVTVARVGGGSPGIEPGSQVVVVPWDYDPGCLPVLWGRSSAWIPASSQRFFFPSLRPESLWVGGLPTFDSFTPEADVFPSRYPSPVFPPVRKQTSPERLFDFYELMPVFDDERSLSEEDRRRVMAWAQSNPDAIEQWPIDALLQSMTYRAEVDRARGRTKAMLGTYRLTATLPQEPPRMAFLRTAVCIREDHWLNRRERSPDPLAPETVGARLRFWVALNEADLESTDRNKRRGTYKWHVGWPDEDRADSTWATEINPRQFRELWNDDPVMKRVFRYRDDWFDRHWDRQDFPAWLGAFDPGALRLTQTIPLRDGGELTLTAERISATTSPCPSEQILTDDPSLPNPPRRD